MATDQKKCFDDVWDNDEPVVDRMSIVEEGENESSSDDSGRKDERAGASNIPFSSSGDSTTRNNYEDLESFNNSDDPPPRHVRKNSKRLNITSTSTSFDPKRQRCPTPNRFYFDREEPPLPEFEANLFKPLSVTITPPSSSRRKSIIQTRVRRTSSVDSFASVRFSETASESDDAHTPPQATRSRKSSRIGATPRSVVSRCSLNDPNSIINQKFIFSPYPEDLITAPGETNANDFAWSLKTKSTDTGLSGFFSIALDFDHKKTNNENDDNSRKLQPLDFSQQPDSAKSSFILPKFADAENSTQSSNSTDLNRVKSFPSTGFSTYSERMTPLLPFQNLSLN